MVSANGACPAFLTASAIDDAGIKNTHGAKIDGAFHIIGFTVTNVEQLIGVYIEGRDGLPKDHRAWFGGSGFI